MFARRFGIESVNAMYIFTDTCIQANILLILFIYFIKRLLRSGSLCIQMYVYMILRI